MVRAIIGTQTGNRLGVKVGSLRDLHRRVKTNVPVNLTMFLIFGTGFIFLERFYFLLAWYVMGDTIRTGGWAPIPRRESKIVHNSALVSVYDSVYPLNAIGTNGAS